MNSLIVTLLELRVFLLSILLSGVVHLTLIGGGWLDSDAPPNVAGQSLAITVTSHRTDLIKEASAGSLEQPPEAVKSEVVSPQLASLIPSASTASKTDKSVISPPVMSKASVESAVLPVKEKFKPSGTKAPVSRLSKEIDDSVQQEVVATAMQAELEILSVPVSPIYQSAPEFRRLPQQPKYPRLARKRGIEGQVILRADIDQNGDIQDLIIEQSSGSDLLDRAARKAVNQWQFLPAQSNGVKVASYVRIPVDFVLEPR